MHNKHIQHYMFYPPLSSEEQGTINVVFFMIFQFASG